MEVDPAFLPDMVMVKLLPKKCIKQGIGSWFGALWRLIDFNFSCSLSLRWKRGICGIFENTYDVLFPFRWQAHDFIVTIWVFRYSKSHWFSDWRSQKHPNTNPYAPCMVYLPTFGWFFSSNVGKYSSTMEHLGNHWNPSGLGNELFWATAATSFWKTSAPEDVT